MFFLTGDPESGWLADPRPDHVVGPALVLARVIPTGASERWEKRERV